MMRAILGAVTLAIALCCGVVIRCQQTPALTPTVTTEYESFMRLDAAQRRERFSTLSPESRAGIVRTHALLWLARHRERLTRTEVAILEEAIASVTPGLYERPMDSRDARHAQEAQARLRCRIDPADAREAFDIFNEQPPAAGTARWSYLTKARCWFEWLVEILGTPPSTFP